MNIVIAIAAYFLFVAFLFVIGFFLACFLQSKAFERIFERVVDFFDGKQSTDEDE